MKRVILVLLIASALLSIASARHQVAFIDRDVTTFTNWSNIPLNTIQQAGINWSNFYVDSSAGINWNVIPGGILGGTLQKSSSGINWVKGVSGTGATSCLCKTFVNGVCTSMGTCT